MHDLTTWLNQLLFGDVYVKVRKNRFELRHIDKNVNKTIVSQSPFTTSRSLIGEFSWAEKALNDGLSEFFHRFLLSPRPRILIQPLEMIDGGLSQVEKASITGGCHRCRCQLG